jgi:hypothetical protein
MDSGRGSTAVRMVAVSALMVFGLAAAQVSHAREESSAALWGALDGKVICGLAIHALNAPDELLCSAGSAPPPRHGNPSIGDPGFVFLRASGRPRPARLSQYSWEQENGWESKHRPTLKSGQSWSSSALGVTCYIRRKAVRCINQSRHGFTISLNKYRAF